MQQENDKVQSEMQGDWTMENMMRNGVPYKWSVYKKRMTVRIDSCRGNTK